MARVNISIPDDLYEAIQERKADLNVSMICQDALRGELARRWPTGGIVEVTEDVIERLRKERDDYLRESRERGYLSGMEWARRAKFASLRQWGERNAPDSPKLKDLATPPIELMDWLFEDHSFFDSTPEVVVERHPELAPLPVLWDLSGSAGGGFGIEYFYFDTGDRASFNEGFLDAVKSFWSSVKDRL